MTITPFTRLGLLTQKRSKTGEKATNTPVKKGVIKAGRLVLALAFLSYGYTGLALENLHKACKNILGR